MSEKTPEPKKTSKAQFRGPDGNLQILSNGSAEPVARESQNPTEEVDETEIRFEIINQVSSALYKKFWESVNSSQSQFSENLRSAFELYLTDESLGKKNQDEAKTVLWFQRFVQTTENLVLDKKLDGNLIKTLERNSQIIRNLTEILGFLLDLDNRENWTSETLMQVFGILPEQTEIFWKRLENNPNKKHIYARYLINQILPPNCNFQDNLDSLAEMFPFLTSSGFYPGSFGKNGDFESCKKISPPTTVVRTREENGEKIQSIFLKSSYIAEKTAEEKLEAQNPASKPSLNTTESSVAAVPNLAQTISTQITQIPNNSQSDLPNYLKINEGLEFEIEILRSEIEEITRYYNSVQNVLTQTEIAIMEINTEAFKTGINPILFKEINTKMKIMNTLFPPGNFHMKKFFATYCEEFYQIVFSEFEELKFFDLKLKRRIPLTEEEKIITAKWMESPSEHFNEDFYKKINGQEFTDYYQTKCRNFVILKLDILQRMIDKRKQEIEFLEIEMADSLNSLGKSALGNC